MTRKCRSVENRLTGAVAADGIHRMRRISQQRYLAVRPARQRIAVAIGILKECPGGSDHLSGLDETQSEAISDEAQRLFQASGAVPVLATWRFFGPITDARHHSPVRQAHAGLRRIEVDRIENELGRVAASNHHRATVRVHRPRQRAAPEQDAAPARRPFAGVEDAADARMDPVRPDQPVTDRFGPLSRATFENCDDAAMPLFKSHQSAIGVEPRCADAVQHGVKQYAEQLATVDGDLGYSVAGLEAAQLMPHTLAKPVGVDQLARANAGLVESG